MTPEERATTILIETCKNILEEPDPVKFQRLVVELVDLLDRVAPEKQLTVASAGRIVDQKR